MPSSAQRRVSRAPAGRPPRAFTLVELVTAASLMTIMMIGVVQIFGIITQTAAEAEGMSFAQQQARVLFDRLNRDIRGMTREGYLYIAHSAIGPVSTSDPYTRILPTSGARAPLPTDSAATSVAVTPENSYFCDSLGFVTIGQTATNWRTDLPVTTGGRKGWPALASEVLYTNLVYTPSNDKTVTNVLEASRSDTLTLKNPRKGLLARALWSWFEYPIHQSLGQGTTLSGHEGADQYDDAFGQSLCDLFGRQGRDQVVGRPFKELTGADGSGFGYYVNAPVWKGAESDTAGIRGLRNILASCVSEFYIETYYPSATELTVVGTSPLQWRMAPTEKVQAYRWSGKYVGAPTTSPSATSVASWPRAIRVTVAIHDPSDNKPLRVGAGAKRAQGYAFQETFLITDP